MTAAQPSPATIAPAGTFERARRRAARDREPKDAVARSLIDPGVLVGGLNDGAGYRMTTTPAATPGSPAVRQHLAAHAGSGCSLGKRTRSATPRSLHAQEPVEMAATRNKKKKSSRT